MSFITWDKSWACAEGELDEHHQRLVSLINDLYEARHDSSAETRQSALAALLTETKSHFAAKEKLMRDKGFPDAKEHAMQHQKLLDSLCGIGHALDLGQDPFDEAMFAFLRTWLLGHLEKEDRVLSRFFAEQK